MPPRSPVATNYSLLEIWYEWLMLAAEALHRRPQLQLKTDSAQQSADCRVIKAEMAVFTRREQAYR